GVLRQRDEEPGRTHSEIRLHSPVRAITHVPGAERQGGFHVRRQLYTESPVAYRNGLGHGGFAPGAGTTSANEQHWRYQLAGAKRLLVFPGRLESDSAPYAERGCALRTLLAHDRDRQPAGRLHT